MFWSIAVTKLLMTLVTSNEVLWMGQDVPPLDGIDFPPLLQELTNGDLINEYTYFVGQTSSLYGTGS